MKPDGEFRALQMVMVRDEDTIGFVLSTHPNHTGNPYHVMYWQDGRRADGWFAATELSTV